MSTELKDIRNFELPLKERQQLFDEKYLLDEIDSLFVKQENGQTVRCTAYSLESEGLGIIPRIGSFLLEAVSIGDTLWATLPVNPRTDDNGNRENVIILSRFVSEQPRPYEAPLVDLS